VIVRARVDAALIIALVVALVVALVGIACTSTPVPGAPRRLTLKVAPDSAVGVVVMRKSSVETVLWLRTGEAADALVSLTMSDEDAASIGRIAGMRAVMRGVATGKSLGVIAFTALSVNGTPVLDGIVRVDRASVALETKGGRIPIGNPPASLYLLDGTRIWLSGPAARGPNDYGVITPAP
jgi:hypothetical protein